MDQKKLFAIGDIHGCARELNELIDCLPLTQQSKLIFLGDYVDRGPDSKGVIDLILELSEEYEVITLLGNHEAMLLEFIRDPSSSLAGYFILNGGSATLASYASEEGRYTIPEHHLRFLENLELFYETETHFFVHAGVPNVKLAQLDAAARKEELLWLRKSFVESSFKWEKIIVHGHTPCEEVEMTKQRINLDTGCVYNNRLTAMEMNSGEIFQVKALKKIPHTYLKEDPDTPRSAKRFLGFIPVFVETEWGYNEFKTINYNEFGLLIVDLSGSVKLFEHGQLLKGKIGDINKTQMDFEGEVVRLQRRGNQVAFGIKMLKLETETYGL